MDKKIAGLLGAAAALTVTTGAGAQAAPAQQTNAAPASYADLLKPVPNAVAALRDDEANAAEAPLLQRVQFHHHHHHHHGFFHHHHHHHHGFFGGGVVIAPPAVVAPGGCWAWGRPYWNGFRWVRRRVWVCP